MNTKEVRYGVDGLEVRAYEDSGGALYTAKLLEIMAVDSVGCEPLCRLSDAQAIPNVPRDFTKKPVLIKAIQWAGDNLDAVLLFCAGEASYELMARGNSELVISTLEDGAGTAKHVASLGDWIIRGVKGEFYPCKPDIFYMTYELSAPAAPAADAGLVEALDYQVLFDAIAAATSVYANGAVNISVQAFRDALAASRAKGVV